MNTVVQRLERVGRLLGPDPNEPPRTLEVQLALTLHRLTQGLWKPGRGQNSTASRISGQVMQWPPPRPRPSSAPTIVMTSTPARRSSAFVWVLRS